MSEVVLRTHALMKRFGGIAATNDVSLAVSKGARHALIGPNGAGKTTLINLLTGVLPATSGRVALLGRDITVLAPHRRVGLGLVRTFQINQLFASFTPLQSLALAVASRLDAAAANRLIERVWTMDTMGSVRPLVDALCVTPQSEVHA